MPAHLTPGSIVDSINTTAIANSPFMVAVSGHRDLDGAARPRLREAVTRFVRQLQEQLPDTQLRMIVGMAEGADLLVAETAVALGVTVEALLPMPLEQYAADFDADAFACLKELLAHPQVRHVELPAPAQAGDSATPPSRVQRDAMYAKLTETLIRRSSLLLALWDGRVSRLPGGTADTVLRYLNIRNRESEGIESLEVVQAHAEADVAERFVYWMPVARSGTDDAGDASSPCFLAGRGDSALLAQYTMPSLLKRQLTELNSYNREFRQLIEAGRLPARSSLVGVLPASRPSCERSTLEDIDAQYGKADRLAVHYQRRSDRLFALFGIMAFTMGLAYLVYDKFTESRLLLIAYVLTLLASVCVYYVLQGRRWFGKHLTYRILAETLRARFFLGLAGAEHRVDAAEVLALSGIDRFRGFGWIALILKGVEPPGILAGRLGDEDASGAGCLEQAWIENQHAYFTGKVARLERSSRRLQRLQQALFIAILGTMSALFIFGGALHRVDLGLGVPLQNVLTFCMGLAAVLLGVWELHQGKMATRELLWQYRNQLTHFTRARLQLARTTSPRRRHDVLAELGKKSLMESYLWAIHRYHREHAPPSGGSR
jgi:hypothetical protein